MRRKLYLLCDRSCRSMNNGSLDDGCYKRLCYLDLCPRYRKRCFNSFYLPCGETDIVMVIRIQMPCPLLILRISFRTDPEWMPDRPSTADLPQLSWIPKHELDNWLSSSTDSAHMFDRYSAQSGRSEKACLSHRPFNDQWMISHIQPMRNMCE